MNDPADITDQIARALDGLAAIRVVVATHRRDDDTILFTRREIDALDRALDDAVGTLKALLERSESIGGGPGVDPE